MDEGALIQVMMQHGHTESTARATIDGRKNDGNLQGLWNEYMGGSSNQGQTPEQIAQDVIDAAQEKIDLEIGWLENYTTENPYVFDEEFARLSATEQYSKHYSDLINEYITGVELQRDTLQDEKKLLQTLYDLGEAKRGRTYDRAVRGAGEGFFGKGMFFSGLRKASQGELRVEEKEAETESDARYDSGQERYRIQSESLDLDEQTKMREIDYEQSEAISQGVKTREHEALVGYNQPLVTAYNQTFPNATTPTAGYTIPDYLQY